MSMSTSMSMSMSTSMSMSMSMTTSMSMSTSIIFLFAKKTETEPKQIEFRFVSVRTETKYCLFRGHPSPGGWERSGRSTMRRWRSWGSRARRSPNSVGNGGARQASVCLREGQLIHTPAMGGGGGSVSIHRPFGPLHVRDLSAWPGKDLYVHILLSMYTEEL